MREEATLPSTMMKPHLDYATNYDVGTDTVTAIQPVINGEVASQGILRRPSENLRGRSETLRAAVDELFYFRDKPTYLLGCAGAGKLDWDGTVAGGGTGVLNNTTELTISPLGGAMANTKGVIGIGTAGTNRVNYTVPNGVYATHGVNRWKVEHRPITGQASIQVLISPGPNYFILVTYDDTNNSHDAFAVAVAANLAIAGNAGTVGKLTASGDAISSNAVSSSSGPVTFFDGVVSATISGTPTVDIEAHTIPAGALGTLTTSTPLVEDATILIAYRDLIEPDAGDALDPKTVLAGGRAESNPARSNTNVVANLVILSGAVTDGLHLSGAIPLVRIISGVARFIDGTSVAGGYSLTPGSALGVEFDASAFHGPTTTMTNGGILTTDETIEDALLTIDTRLAQRRTATWTVTDSSASVGGDYDSVTAVIDAAEACGGGGGVVKVRRGSYGCPSAGFHGVQNVVLEGEDGTLPEWTFDVAAVGLTGPLTIRNMKLSRLLGVTVSVAGGLTLENCEFDSGLFNATGGGGVEVKLVNCKMLQTSQAATPIYGLRADVERLTVIGGTYDGPDSLVVAMSATPATRLGVFETNEETTLVDIRGAFITNDARAGWMAVTCMADNDVGYPRMATIELANSGAYRSTSNYFQVGSPVDLSTSKETTRVAVPRGGNIAEPTRVVMHPPLPLDLSDDPSTRAAPSWMTPELELVEVTDPRDAPVVGYVELPAAVTITDAGSIWQVDFDDGDARGTLEFMAAGDVVEIVNVGFYRIYGINRDAPTGSLSLWSLDTRPLVDAAPVGTQTLRYYRVIRGHLGGLSETGLGQWIYGPTEPDMDYLPGDVEVGEEHRFLGGLVIDGGDNGGGFTVGRRRGDALAVPTTDQPNFTPDFIIGRVDGITYARALFAKAATFAAAAVSGVFGVGAILDLEALLTSISGSLATAVATLGTWVNAAGEWNYAAPLSLPLTLDPTAGTRVTPSGTAAWTLAAGAGGYPVHAPLLTGAVGEFAYQLTPLTLPRGYIITSIDVYMIGTAASSALVTTSLHRSDSPTALETDASFAVGNTIATQTLTVSPTQTMVGHTYSLKTLIVLADTASVRISSIVVNGTIPGPR
jgi:hypothetical protein